MLTELSNKTQSSNLIMFIKSSPIVKLEKDKRIVEVSDNTNEL